MMSIQRLGERENWICWLCRERVDPTDRGVHRPSRDHIVRQKDGGTDHCENLGLAHQSCNSAREEHAQASSRDVPYAPRHPKSLRRERRARERFRNRFLWLQDILPGISAAIDFDNYVESERELVSPALEAFGYELNGTWFTGDGDSFGPLTRCIRTDRGVVIYG